MNNREDNVDGLYIELVEEEDGHDIFAILEESFVWKDIDLDFFSHLLLQLFCT